MGTTFAALGAALAYIILLALFGFHWQLVPGGVAGLAAAYVVSTSLGGMAAGVQAGRHLPGSVVIGIGVALLTLLAGIVAIGLTNFAIETGRELVRAPSGQPFWNAVAEFAPQNARDFVAKPVFWGSAYGLLPAAVLGFIYGIVLRARFDATDIRALPTRKWMIAAAGGVVLMFVLLAASLMQGRSSGFRGAGQLADLPMAIAGCGELNMNRGVLAWCQGYPCKEGECQWDGLRDAFAVYVLPPDGGGWSWVGGGIGTGRRPEIIEHHTYWVRREPAGFLDEGTPRRHASYRLKFEDELIKVGDQAFKFDPGMLLVVRFSAGWSVTAGAGAEALEGTLLSDKDLQGLLDQACASRTQCEQSFRIRR